MKRQGKERKKRQGQKCYALYTDMASLGVFATFFFKGFKESFLVFVGLDLREKDKINKLMFICLSYIVT